eukprot:CAMPEP_0184867374 /NCGR_PEP_ID=MMETSP0580-20130426/26263_1 /TAXON_ID=1118495 /ORGANISM="Dactyliosolen fragilissimus" /LENGTH=986 /DNA_ID=CAMNT_0027367619 /DNA_START=117 /DNA_END=3077 /DNA_ORIENTATION=+
MKSTLTSTIYLMLLCQVFLSLIPTNRLRAVVIRAYVVIPGNKRKPHLLSQINPLSWPLRSSRIQIRSHPSNDNDNHLFHENTPIPNRHHIEGEREIQQNPNYLHKSYEFIRNSLENIKQDNDVAIEEPASSTPFTTNARSINVELATRGNKFDSLHRRFDFLPSYTRPSTDSANASSLSSLSLPLIWKRLPDQNVNVTDYLQTSRNISDIDRANHLATDECLLYFQQPQQDASNNHANSIRSGRKDLEFQVNEVHGTDMASIPITLVTKQDSNNHNSNAKGRNDNNPSWKQKSFWEGNKYVTLTYHNYFDNDQSDVYGIQKERVVERVERYLNYRPSGKGVIDAAMIVDSFFYQTRQVSMDNKEIKEEHHIASSCRQIYTRLIRSTANDSSPDLMIRDNGEKQSRMDSNYLEKGILSSATERVPGCVATVRVRTTLIPMNHSHDTNENLPLDATSYSVVLDGEADALLSSGLLATLSHLLSQPGMTAAHAMEIDPNGLAKVLGLDSVLSVGRNDGLASMVNVVQNQISSLLNPDVQSTMRNKNILSTESIDTERTPRKELFGKQKQRPKVAVLLSGGVDSAVALNILLHQFNYDVTAFYLKIWLEDELAHLGSECPWEDDYKTCVAVCEAAGGVPLETISLQNEYKERVISYTVQEAKKGRTPNPDIMCNSRIKFGCFYDAIEGRGFDFVASGHYAHLTTDNETFINNEEVNRDKGTKRGIMKLMRAPDPVKDQSFFLSALTQSQLQRVIFPLGKFHKSEVRELAQQFDLPNKNRPDSQGLCFLGKVKFDEFLAAYLGNKPGDVVDAHTREVIGRHRGVWFHTVGQRKGIGKVLNPLATSRGPWYVVAKDPSKNLIIASNRYDEDTFEAARSEFYVEDIHWIAGSAPKIRSDKGRQDFDWCIRLDMKIRHGPNIVGGSLHIDEKSAEGSAGNIKLDQKDGGLAPGQFVAFYEPDGGEICLGSGVISERHWARFLMTEKIYELEHEL